MISFLASFGGAGLAGLIQALLAPDFDGETLFREALFVSLFGNWAVGLATGAFSAWKRLPSAAAFGLGLALGLAPFFVQHLGPAGGPLLSLALAAAALTVCRRLHMGNPGATGAGIATVLLTAVSLILAEPEVEKWLMPHPPLAPGGEAPAATGPDYVLIVADTLRADAVLDPEIPTPNLDALRARGTWAAYALASNNQTLPSHLCLLTCLDVERHGMRSNFSRWPRSEQLESAWNSVPLAERFRRSGWRTAAVVSNLLLDRVNTRKGLQGFSDGFETWYCRLPLDGWRAYGLWKADYSWYGWLTRLAGLNNEGNKFIRNLFNPHGPRGVRRHFEEGADTTRIALEYLGGLLDQPRPYFLLVHYMDPHTPYVAPAPYRGSLADPAALPPGSDTSLEGEFELREIVRAGLAGARPRAEWEPYARYLHDAYREEVAYLDAQLGPLLQRIEEGGRPTVILFTSDHGEAFGEHGSMEHGGTLHGEEVEVPFILAGPGVPAGAQLAAPPELVDVSRTLIEHAGLDPAGASGRSLLTGAAQRPGLSLMPGLAALEEDGWRAYFRVEYGDPPERNAYTLTPLWLFHLAADPGEARNLLGEQPARVAALRRALEARLADDLFPELDTRSLSNQERADLSELGYTLGTDGQDQEQR